jgi:pilus assembly protein TadC
MSSLNKKTDEINREIKKLRDSIISGNWASIQFLQQLSDNNNQIGKEEYLDLIVRAILMEKISEKVERRREKIAEAYRQFLIFGGLCFLTCFVLLFK